MSIVQRIEGAGCGCHAVDDVKTLISIDDAVQTIRDHMLPVTGSETIAVSEAHGRTLAEPVVARGHTPPFDNAAMDGFAVNSETLEGKGPWRLKTVDRIPAGQPAISDVGHGCAARIFTGAPVPNGANAVIIQEGVQRYGDEIVFSKRPSPGLNIRRVGDDMRVGDKILAAGRRLGAREIAACAAAGRLSVRVSRETRVSLLVTGNEFPEAECGLGSAQIWDVNSPMLTATLENSSAQLVGVWRGRDNVEDLTGQLREMFAVSDLVVTTGGISIGEEDHVKPALVALGAELSFSGVAMKPGKPVSFGRVGSSCWLGLPGNPLAAYVTWSVFGPVVLGELAGNTTRRTTRRYVVTERSIQRKPGRCELRPATIVGFDGNGREIVQFDQSTHSGRVARLPDADGLMFLPADTDWLPEGALVEFQPFCEI